LKPEKYTKEVEGATECAICMIDYKEGDKIIKLECSPM